MSSQTDKKEEFRKYLDKGHVLTILTTVLTDLFELEPKPEDPAPYLYQKFGEELNKYSKPPAKPASTDAPQKDIEMHEAPQTNPPIALPSKPAESETAPQPPPAQQPTEPKPPAPEQSDPPSQQLSQTDPASAAATTPNPPLSLPATSQ